MSNKSFILGLGLWLVAGLASCQHTPLSNEEPNRDQVEQTDTPIRLGVTELGNSGRAGGTVLSTIDQITGEHVVLYGVCELFGATTRSWAEADRLIDNTAATIELDPALNDYKLNYAATEAYYPAGGSLNVYALYPNSGSSYLTLIDDKLQAPQVVVSLADRFHKQYDVLHGQSERLTVAQAQQARVTFEHTLAQLQLKIYRDPEATAHPTLSKIVVRGVSKATLASIERPDYTNSTLPADSLDFIAFQGSMPLTATTKETALALNADSALMLFPGLASISRIEATIDGNTFTTIVPKTWDLLQGKTNTLTLTLNKMGLRLETPWETTPWQAGQGVDQELENNGKMIRISGTMLNASGLYKTAYAGAAPTKADITLLGFTHHGVAVESVAAGLFTTALFNSGSLNDNPLYLEGLTLYDASGRVLFAGQLNNNGKFASGARIYIDEQDKGLLKKDNPSGAAVGLSLTFGGFGDGTVALPYEVHSPFLLDNINNLLGSNQANATNALNGTERGGAKFIQTADINLAGSSFLGLAQSATFYGIYDGQKHKIKNVNLHANGVAYQYVGLFAKVSLTNFISTLITQVVVEGGVVRNTNTGAGTGALVGTLAGGAVVSYCSNSASVTGLSLNVGGLVGLIGGTSKLTHSANFGSVSSNTGALGGLIGRSSSNAAFVVSDCYNAGSVTYTGSAIDANVGGVIGYLVMGSATPTVGNCYNRGSVSHPTALLNAPTTGSVVGVASGSGGLLPTSNNSYWLTGSYPTGVGSNVANVASKLIEKSTTELKALAPTLGSPWKADYTTNPINEGFPILMWQ